MTAFTLTFDPTGKGRGFYTEAIDLPAIGTLEVRRATTLEFNNARQAWEVMDPEGTILFADPSRAACLRWEHHQFNR